MIKPNDREKQAIRGLYAASPQFTMELIDLFIRARDHERSEMEASKQDMTETCKGKCIMLTEQINVFKSLLPKGG